MKYISLFAGIGGFDYALNRLGMECVYANEWDKYAAQVYDKNFRPAGKDKEEISLERRSPNIKGSEPRKSTSGVDTRDIRTVATSEIPEHDLLVGGFPCQAFSIAGKRRGFDDTRGTLFFEIARILKDKQPKYFILENVKGLLSHDNGNTFKTIISTLTELGYDLQWQIVNSKNFGVPQNRERVFIVGHLRGEPRPEVFPITGDDNPLTTKGGEQASSTVISRTLTATDAKMHLDGNYVKQVNNPTHSNNRVYDDTGISPTLNTMQGGRRQPKIAIPVLTPDRAEKRQNGRRFKENGEPSFTLTGQDIHGVALYDNKPSTCNYCTIPKYMHAYCETGFNMGGGTWEFSTREDYEAGTTREISDEDWNKILYCRKWTQELDKYDIVRPQPVLKIRRLTPTECERLQGFPDGWTEGISDTQRYKCLGNAVTVNVVYEIAKRLVNSLEKNANNILS